MSLATQLESIPYIARELSRSELQRLDVYLYDSPKLTRRLSVVRPAALVLALKFEFTADVEAFVERPRTLQVDTSHHELSFNECFNIGREFEFQRQQIGRAHV